MTKEEILAKHYPDFDIESGWMFDGPVSQVFEAMEQHARNRSIEFDMWKRENYWQYNIVERFYFRWENNYEDRKTPLQLYELFSQQIDNHSIDK